MIAVQSDGERLALDWNTPVWIACNTLGLSSRGLPCPPHSQPKLLAFEPFAAPEFLP